MQRNLRAAKGQNSLTRPGARFEARWALAVVAGIILVNFPALLHLVDVNPVDQLAGATRSATRGPLPGSMGIDVATGYVSQALGHSAALEWLHGTVPWWNPLEGIGSPLAADMQTAAFFPPVLLFALPDGSLYFHVLLEIAAGLSTWFLIRELGMSLAVAAVGGLLFGLAGTFDWLWNAAMNPVPLLPLALFGLERIYRRPRGDSGWIVLALALALSVYAGFPETSLLYLPLLIGWAVLRLIQSKQRWAVMARCLLGGVIGLLLSLPLVVPLLDYLPYASLAMNPPTFGYIHLGGAGLPVVGSPYFYGPIAAFDPVSPRLTLFWGTAGGFISATTLVIGVAGLLGSRRETGLRWLLSFVGIVSLLWSFGVEPFSSLTGLFPGLDHVWVSRYSAPVWEMAAVIAACFGFDALSATRRFRIALLTGSAVALILLAATLLGAPGAIAAAVSHADGAAHDWAIVSVAWTVGAVLLITVAGLKGGSRWSRTAVGVLLALDAAALAFLPQLSAPRSATLDSGPVRFLHRHLALGRYYSFSVYHPNYGSYFGLASIDTVDAPMPKAWSREITTRLGSNTVPWRFDGIHVQDPSGATAVTQAMINIHAYETLDVRYFVVADPVPPVFDRLHKVFDDRFVSIFALPHPSPYFATVGSACAIGAQTRDSAVTTCGASATLVRSELDLPGWSATVNGRPTPVLDYKRLLTAVRIPAGRSRVRFSYAPPGVFFALTGFGLGLLVLVGLPVAQSWRRRCQSTTAAAAKLS